MGICTTTSDLGGYLSSSSSSSTSSTSKTGPWERTGGPGGIACTRPGPMLNGHQISITCDEPLPEMGPLLLCYIFTPDQRISLPSSIMRNEWTKRSPRASHPGDAVQTTRVALTSARGGKNPPPVSFPSSGMHDGNTDAAAQSPTSRWSVSAWSGCKLENRRRMRR